MLKAITAIKVKSSEMRLFWRIFEIPWAERLTNMEVMRKMKKYHFLELSVSGLHHYSYFDSISEKRVEKVQKLGVFVCYNTVNTKKNIALQTFWGNWQDLTSLN